MATLLKNFSMEILIHRHVAQSKMILFRNRWKF